MTDERERATDEEGREARSVVVDVPALSFELRSVRPCVDGGEWRRYRCCRVALAACHSVKQSSGDGRGGGGLCEADGPSSGREGDRPSERSHDSRRAFSPIAAPPLQRLASRPQIKPQIKQTDFERDLRAQGSINQYGKQAKAGFDKSQKSLLKRSTRLSAAELESAIQQHCESKRRFFSLRAVSSHPHTGTGCSRTTERGNERRRLSPTAVGAKEQHGARWLLSVANSCDSGPNAVD